MSDVRRPIHWVLFACFAALLLLLISGPLPGLAIEREEENIDIVELKIRVAYIYGDETARAQQYVDFLDPEGYETDLISLADLPGPIVYIPVVASSGAASQQAAQQNGQSPADLDLNNYDLVIVAHDTAGMWDAQRGTGNQIVASGKYVVAIGAGGAEFFQKFARPDFATATEHDLDTLVAADKGASAPFYSELLQIDLDQDDAVKVLKQNGKTRALAIGPQPDAVRVAQLPGSSVYPLVLANDHILLWGLYAGPQAMTAAGRNLFLNSLWYGGSKLAIPIAGGGDVPQAGMDDDFLDRVQEGDPFHGLGQLGGIPNQEMRDALADRGVVLGSYLSGGYYHMLIEADFDPDDSMVQEAFRWVGLAGPELTLDPRLSQMGTSAADQEPAFTTAIVFFHPDVPRGTQESILREAGTSFAYYSDNAYQVPLNAELFQALAAVDEVQWIGAGPTPPQDTNDGARAATGSNTVQNATVPSTGAPTYLGLTGQGVRVAQFERKPDQTHPDLSGRALYGGQAHANNSSHATHVAGIIIGSGQDSINQGGSNYQWRGHAPQASLVSESYGTSSGSALNDNFSDAILDNGAEISNHSYVQAYGVYDAAVQGVDTLVRGQATDSDGDTIPPRLAIWAAANQGDWAQYDNEEGFYSIYSPAKNILTVGSIDSNDMGYSMFSSKGPTFDGRIKPDVMAPGCQNGGDNAITSTENGGGYTTKCGTSMAAPATAGVAALVLEQYHQTYGASATPLPSTLKALLVNTATDLIHTASDGSDTNDQDLCRAQGPGGSALDPSDPLDPDCWTRYGPGPDYATGYGAINAVAAVNAVRGKLFLEDSLGPGDTTDDFTFTVAPNRDELRFTLVWDDEPGSASLGVTVNQLVNDLDLRLIGPDGTHFPFVLDPLPANASLGGGGLDPIDQSDLADAYTADNDRDNVEMVVVANPAAGSWTLRVTVEGGFPTGNPQPYSVAGDMRTFTIVEPSTSTPADGGEENDPATFLVILEADQPHVTGGPDSESTFADAVAGDFQVSIDGTAADIISGTPAGDQFWLMVRGQSGVYSPGYYDLQVTWNGYGSDSVTDGVLFLQRRVADRVIVVDHSGSMIDYDKMQAAQNAGRLFVDQSLEDDRVAVVGFSTNASSPYPIQVVGSGSNPPQLAAAKAAIDGLSPTNQTAIGKGLLRGKSEIDTPGGSSEIYRMILLSDGMENVSPYYDTPAVKGVIQPTDIIVDTVAVGPPSAGMHTLLETIAGDNGGRDFHVTESGSGGTLAAPDSVAATADPWALPQTLENRLADQYKVIAEEIRREQRLWQVSGEMQENADRDSFEVLVDDELKQVTFAINWNTPQAVMALELRDPNGRAYSPGDPDVIYRSDPTHETWIINEPQGGTWAILVTSFEAPAEYIAWLSAHTRVNFQAFIATPPEERAAGKPVQILALLHDKEPLPDAKVQARIVGPEPGTLQDLQLFDDGMHGDGDKGDGIYGNTYTNGYVPGNYALRARADGQSSAAQPFSRVVNNTFYMRSRALYVHDGDRETAVQVRDLLQDNGWAVDLAQVDDVPGMDLGFFSLVIIGPETGDGDRWGSEAAFGNIIQNEIPILGLNEGGYAFFGLLKLQIGYPNGAHTAGAQIVWNRPGESIWRYPYDLTPLPRGPLPLYQENSPLVEIFLNGEEPGGVNVYGWNATDQEYAAVATENAFFMLWGYRGAPELMTDQGRQLFVNGANFIAFGPLP